MTTLHCDTTLSEGCTCFHPRTFSICCNLCNLEVLQYLNFKIVPREKQLGKSQIKGFKMTEISQQLQIDLFDWYDKVITKFPQAHVEDFGGRLLLSDQHILCIFQCASCHQSTSEEDPLEKRLGCQAGRVSSLHDSQALSSTFYTKHLNRTDSWSF